MYRVSFAHMRHHMRIIPFCCAVEKIRLGTVEKLLLLFYSTVPSLIYTALFLLASQSRVRYEPLSVPCNSNKSAVVIISVY